MFRSPCMRCCPRTSSSPCPTNVTERSQAGSFEQPVWIERLAEPLAIRHIFLQRIAAAELDTARADELEAVAAEIADIGNLAVLWKEYLRAAVLAAHGLACAFLDLSATAVRIGIELGELPVRPDYILDDRNHVTSSIFTLPLPCTSATKVTFSSPSPTATMSRSSLTLGANIPAQNSCEPKPCESPTAISFGLSGGVTIFT